MGWPKGQNCLNCHAFKIQHAGGLCDHCWELPGIGEKFPPGRVVPRRVRQMTAEERQEFTESPSIAIEEGTKAPPGTEEKVLIMLERAAKRLPIFHPEDVA